MRAKFRCQQTTTHESGSVIVELYAVQNGSEENKSFAKYTPSGSLKMIIDQSVEVINFFIPGKDYYLDLTEVPVINNNFSVTG